MSCSRVDFCGPKLHHMLVIMEVQQHAEMLGEGCGCGCGCGCGGDSDEALFTDEVRGTHFLTVATFYGSPRFTGCSWIVERCRRRRCM